MKLWQKILIGVAVLAFLIYNRGNSLIWVGAIFVVGSLSYNHFRPRRPSHAEGSAVPAAKKQPRGPRKRLFFKTMTAIGGLLAVLVGAAVLWALPYIIAAATLGEVCPWTPPGITDPSWSCDGSTPSGP